MTLKDSKEWYKEMAKWLGERREKIGQNKDKKYVKFGKGVPVMDIIEELAVVGYKNFTEEAADYIKKYLSEEYDLKERQTEMGAELYVGRKARGKRKIIFTNPNYTNHANSIKNYSSKTNKKITEKKHSVNLNFDINKIKTTEEGMVESMADLITAKRENNKKEMKYLVKRIKRYGSTFNYNPTKDISNILQEEKNE